MKSFGIVGAGTMGSGIAQKVAIEGYPVTVVDISDAALERGRSLMDGIFEQSLERKLMRPEQLEAIRDSISFTTDYAALSSADLIVEAVFEDKAVKAEVFKKIEEVAAENATIATNTSSFPVKELATTLKRPASFVGLHYFYHPVKNRLLEVIPGPETSPTALGIARRFCALQGKVEILCQDSPGFVVNRYFVPWLNEAVRILSDGIASVDVIEATCKQGFRLGMGPFELMNVTGVPIAEHAARGLAEYLGEFYLPDPALTNQVTAGQWEIAPSEEFSETVFHRMLGVTWAVAGTLVDEGTCKPLDIDLGAQVGLRWPLGPFSLMGKLDKPTCEAAAAAFSGRYPDYQLPGVMTGKTVYSIPAVVSEQQNGVSVVALARPDKSNALNAQVFDELNAELERATGASVLVLRGLGKNFAAGADIRFFIKNMEAGQIDRIVEFTASAQQVLKRIDDFPGKVVAAIDGFALGGGAEMMLAADVIAVTPRALIGFPETGIGIFPGLGGGYRLAHRIGPELATYLVSTGQLLDGKAAQELGLADHCVAADQMAPDLLAELEPAPARDLSGKWAAVKQLYSENGIDDLLGGEFQEDWQQKIQHKLRGKAPIALKMAADLIAAAGDLSIDEEYAAELALLPSVFATEDAMTGLKSVGKYKPEFSGK